MRLDPELRDVFEYFGVNGYMDQLERMHVYWSRETLYDDLSFGASLILLVFVVSRLTVMVHDIVGYD